MAAAADMGDEDRFLDIISATFDKYIECGARSAKKVDLLHESIINYFIQPFIETLSDKDKYSVELECNVVSCNGSGRKKCDIVMQKEGVLFAIFPVKFIMTNYKQNKNNSWENQTGELVHLKWASVDLHIIPINIIFSRIPYLQKGGLIGKWEDIRYEQSFKVYEVLKERQIATDLMNYIIDVEQVCGIGEKYDKKPTIKSFSDDTPFKSFASVLTPLCLSVVEEE